MTLEETRELLMSINALYPNWNVENPEFTVNAWHWALEDYPAPAVKAALQMYVKTNNTGFAPSVSQIISGLYKPQEVKIMTEGEAWNLVKKAIQDGNYHAEERFNELPATIQKAIGSPNMIQQWAATESDEVNTVIMSNFQRAYKAVVQRSLEDAKIGALIMDMPELIGEKQENLLEGV